MNKTEEYAHIASRRQNTSRAKIQAAPKYKPRQNASRRRLATLQIIS